MLDTMVSGNPNLANSSCNTFIVVFVVGVLYLRTSGDFVKLSTMTKSMFLLSDRHSQYVDETTGLSVLVHELNLMGGAFATDLHPFSIHQYAVAR